MRRCTVTDQALMPYSRLHLVVRDKRKIRWVLVMIITNFFLLHIPIMILSQTVSIPMPLTSAPAYLRFLQPLTTMSLIRDTLISLQRPRS